MRRAFLAVSSILVLGGCSTLESLNPFSSSAPKMAELSPITTTVDAQVAWHSSAGKAGLYVFTPAVVANSVYAAGSDGTVIRVDGGAQVWKIDAEQELSGGVGADSTMVVVGTPKGEVLAFSSADGKPLWKADATSSILSPPVLGQGLVVVRSGDNRVAAYEALTGKRKWIYQRPTPALSLRTTSNPIIDGRFVFIGFPAGKLIALSTDNGAAMWEGTVVLPKGATELDRVADITSAPVIADRMVCAVAFQGRISCFDLGNGNLLWGRDMSSSVGLSIDSRYVYVTDDKGAVHALDRGTGASIWKQDKLYLRKVTAPVPLGTLVAVGDAEGVVHLLNQEDGSFSARLTTDGSPIVAPLQTLSGKLFVQTSRGGVFAIETR